jgi:hypothetical protein
MQSGFKSIQESPLKNGVYGYGMSTTSKVMYSVQGFFEC